MKIRMCRPLSLLRAILLGLLVFSAPAYAEICSIIREDATARVSHVHDADTVRLTNGERVRILGIDAPELARDGQPDEPFAAEGRDFLRELLAEHDNRVVLHYGNETHDRYGRRLAWLFLPDGSNVQRLLLEQGLVMQVFVSPNLDYADCLMLHEQGARLARRGIWSQTEYHPGIDSVMVPETTRGAAIVKGEVVRIGESRDNIWINLEGGVALQIRRENLGVFGDLNLERLKGKLVRARGWLVKEDRAHHQWRMRLDDRRALELLN
ncbi:thermonuclease family protein [Nitrincola alkalilacustris]|uniref:thermonuclease family protein n=1 Tax=Nitrincola alkalilacustris TaxID=1571224 RepID=UPI00124EC189|nr:thermonuclease family protein [Nitrincola alkalilacustris]